MNDKYRILDVVIKENDEGYYIKAVAKNCPGFVFDFDAKIVYNTDVGECQFNYNAYQITQKAQQYSDDELDEVAKDVIHEIMSDIFNNAFDTFEKIKESETSE